jgi:alkanesulfonate monooxygenase SsuD/methylene tetrahydromethanopterin reductase-like flavin-dependent oxidoreductase (luciferase family)
MTARPIELGVSLTPDADRAAELVELALVADRAGLDLIGIQDHPYQRRFLDTWTLLSVLAARTERIGLFPDVANLPLRPPAVLANAAASLDVLSGGRAELGLGAGGFWEAIVAMGGQRRSPGESVDALAEAIEVIRLVWSDERAVSFDGRHYQLAGYHPGPAPAHRIEIWLGAYKPRMLALTGRAADGWLPSLGRFAPAAVPDAQAAIDEAARTAGRDPAAIRRMLNVAGTITDGARGPGPLDGPAEHWVETLAGLATELRFDTFVFWPAAESAEQIERFAGEVAPALRRL